MMVSNGYMLVFALAFLGCILATPVVTRLASAAGAVDRPDRFRRIHKGAIPRLGGLAVAFGIGVVAMAALVGLVLPGQLAGRPWTEAAATALAALVVLVIGVVDDTRGLAPRMKLLGQSAAVLVLIVGGIRISHFSLLGLPFDIGEPWSAGITILWFLACMNIWNLIDGMDGLASGVGLLVSGTLMLVAIREGNSPGSALLAAALAGSLAGFLLYNWHPACIFLGDSGSMLIGLLIGVIGVQSSMKGTTTVSILFPILAMGLPITDTAMAIFRRWVRDLPLSAADRRHVHHLLIGLGLNPRQAALMLYSFSGFLCGVVLLGVTLNNKVHGEFFALLLGGCGVLAFLLILTSRRDELACLVTDLRTRKHRKRQEREAATLTWESIQRIELCESPPAIWEVLVGASRELGCDALGVDCHDAGRPVLQREWPAEPVGDVSGSTACFRLDSGESQRLVLRVGLPADAEPACDIAFRCLQRLALAAAQRIERLRETGTAAAYHVPIHVDAATAAIDSEQARRAG